MSAILNFEDDSVYYSGEDNMDGEEENYGQSDEFLSPRDTETVQPDSETPQSIYVEAMSQSVLDDGMNELFAVTETEMNPEITAYIDSMVYPKVLLGNVNRRANPHSQLMKLGELDAKGKILFKYVNTVLQFPPCVVACNNQWKPRTQRAYSYQIARYVLYVSNHTNLNQTNFVVDGNLMLECVKNIPCSATEVPASQESKIGPKFIPLFKYALQVLQKCLGIYKTAKIHDKQERAEQIKRKWLNIPYLGLLDDYHREKLKTVFKQSKKKHLNKNNAKMFQKKYSIADCKNMMINMLEKTGSGRKKDIYDGINATLEFLLGHHLMLRGLLKTELELSDSVYSAEETSHGTVPILGFQLVRENTRGRSCLPGILGVCRNKDVEICLVSAFALSLWYRFDFQNQHAPLSGGRALNFMDKGSWYDPKVLFASSDESKHHKPISPAYAENLVSMCLNSIGFESLKKSRLGRKKNGEKVEVCLVEEAQLHRSGKWNLDVIQSRYISAYAYEFIHFSGGFKPEEPYRLSRDVAPPEELQRLIFPWLGEVLAKVKNRTDEANLSFDDRDGAAPRFLEMLKKFRSIILQDLALLVDLAPNSIYSNHPITKHVLFLEFKEKVKEKVNDCSLFSETQEKLHEADSLATSFGQKINNIRMGMEFLNKNVRNTVQALQSDLRDLSNKIPKVIENSVRGELFGLFVNLFANQNQILLQNTNEILKQQIAELKQNIDGLQHSLEALTKQCYEMLKKCMETLQHETQKLSGALQVIMNSMKIEHESPEKILNDSPAQSNNRPFQLFSPIKRKFDSSEQANDKYVHHSDDQDSILRKKIKINPTSRYYSIPKTVEDCFKTPGFRMLPKDIPVSTLMKEFHISIPGRPSLLERESKYGAKWRYDQLALWKFKKTFFNFVTKTSEELNVAPSVVAQIMDTIAQQQGLRGMASMRVKIQDSLLQKEMLREISNILTDQQETNNNNEVI